MDWILRCIKIYIFSSSISEEHKSRGAEEDKSSNESNTHLSSPSTTPKPTCSTRVSFGSYQPASATTAKHVLRWTAWKRKKHAQ